MSPAVLLFFVSGVVGLMGEVVFNRLMTFVFGSSHLATSTVLAAYMGGLALGAWLLGDKLELKIAPVRLYGLLELAVATWFLGLALGFPLLRELLLPLLRALDGSPHLVIAARFACAVAIVLLPTVLMGGSLPVLVKGLSSRDLGGATLPTLYAANTLGAAVGALSATYVAIPGLGLDGTLLLSAAIDGGVGLAALQLAGRLGSPLPGAAEGANAAAEAQETPPEFSFSPRMVLLLAALQGALSFSLEVVWSHLLGTTIGVTTHAFALMLFTLLVGLGIGSLLWRRMGDGRPERGVQGFALGMALVALGLAVSLRLWDKFLYAVLLTPSLSEPGHFAGREFVRLLFCALVVLPTAVGLGLGLPALVSSTAAARRDPGLVGRAFAFNTVGAMVGSLATGFLLLGTVPTQTLLIAQTGAAVLLAGLALRTGREDWQAMKGTVTAWVAALLLLVTVSAWELPRLTSGSHYYWDSVSTGEIAWSREDAQSGFVTVRVGGPKEAQQQRMETNGKYEGTDRPAEFQDLFALIGAAYLEHFDSAVVVGLGPARTLRTLHLMPFKEVVAVEYSPAIVAAARERFQAFSLPALDDAPRVRLVVDDGRNFLQSTTTSFDYVAIAISGAAFAGASNIYSEDFFRAVKARLRPGGVFMLWLQLHHVGTDTYRDVLRTLSTQFPHIHFHATDWTQGFAIASEAPLALRRESLARLSAIPALGKVMHTQEMAEHWQASQTLVLSTPEAIDRAVKGGPGVREAALLTDMRPRFEYDAAHALAEWTETDPSLDGWFDPAPPRFEPPLDALDTLRAQAARLGAFGGAKRALTWLDGQKAAGAGELPEAERAEWERKAAREAAPAPN